MSREKSPKNDLNRCPYCGATDTTLDPATGKLKCNYCRALFDPQIVNGATDLHHLKGEVIGSGATQIIPDAKDILTIKCTSCGAEIVIDTKESTTARCHWCRHHLSINQTIPNGAVPDMVLPFKTVKNTAETKIREFVAKRQFFAHPEFKKEFTTENIMGVYLPYMVVDLNTHVLLEGQAEHLVRTYTSGGKNKTRYYDADLYNVSRDFDLLIDDLTIEASKDKLHQNTLVNTNNIINSVMPFDTENCVSWNANYLRGFASEKRDTDVSDLKNQLTLQARDVARYKANETMTFYDRGAKWQTEKFDVYGVHWKAAYLPIWLYSYLEEPTNGKKLLHYVAVNARTGETMGSVPIHKTKLLAFSIIIEIIGIILGITWFLFFIGIDFEEDNPALFGLIGLTPGFIYYWWMTNRYRNMSARHYHEAETKATSENIKKTDTFIEHRTRLRNSQIEGINNQVVTGTLAKGNTQMLGEKMAKALGINQMKGTPNITAPQTNPDQIAKKSRTGIIIATIIIFFIIFIFATVLINIISTINTYTYDSDTYNHYDYSNDYNNYNNPRPNYGDV